LSNIDNRPSHLSRRAEDESRVPVGLSAIWKLTDYPQYASIHAICIAVHLQDMNGDSYRMKLSRHKRSPRCRVSILPLRFFMQPNYRLIFP
jgi:hypothetical protein